MIPNDCVLGMLSKEETFELSLSGDELVPLGSRVRETT